MKVKREVTVTRTIDVCDLCDRDCSNGFHNICFICNRQTCLTCSRLFYPVNPRTSYLEFGIKICHKCEAIGTGWHDLEKVLQEADGKVGLIIRQWKAEESK